MKSNLSTVIPMVSIRSTEVNPVGGFRARKHRRRIALKKRVSMKPPPKVIEAVDEEGRAAAEPRVPDLAKFGAAMPEDLNHVGTHGEDRRGLGGSGDLDASILTGFPGGTGMVCLHSNDSS